MEPVKRLLSWLVQPAQARLQILALLCILSVHARIQEYFDRNFGPDSGRGKARRSHKANKIKLFALDDELDPSNKAITSAGFPAENKLHYAFRVFSTSWQIYLVARYLLGQQVGKLIVRLRGKPLERPIGCYLAGRYILHESMADMTGAVFATSHLAWRLSQRLASAYRMNLVFFLLMAERDLERAHKKLDSAGSIALSLDEIQQLEWRDKFILETLCFRIRSSETMIIYKIRPNRTREAHLRIRQLLARGSLVAWSLVGSISLFLVITFTIMIVTDERFVRVYPNCDPHLERLKAEGKLSSWSITFTMTRLLAGIADGLENLALWWDGGALWTLAPVFIYCLNYDLVLAWRAIDLKIDRLYWQLKEPDEVWPRKHARELRELEALISDFFEQVSMANVFLSNFLDGVMSLSLLNCAAYSYFFQIEHMQQVPLSVALVLSYMVICVTFACSAFLIVNRHCVASYTRLCSLMLLEPSWRGRQNLQGLLEYFQAKRTCFTFLHNYPFETTTFLTVIGWSVSCFFVISTLLQRDSPVVG